MERTQEEIAEIERHKYFLSEKAGHDVGWVFAERDWDEKFGRQLRNDCAATTPCPAPAGGIKLLFSRMFARKTV